MKRIALIVLLSAAPEDYRPFIANSERVFEEDFDLICGAHGIPVRNAKPALAQLLDLDWAPLLAAGKHPFVPV